MITIKNAGKGTRTVHIGERFIGELQLRERRDGRRVWFAIPLNQVAHAFPAGIGSHRNSLEAAKLLA